MVGQFELGQGCILEFPSQLAGPNTIRGLDTVLRHQFGDVTSRQETLRTCRAEADEFSLVRKMCFFFLLYCTKVEFKIVNHLILILADVISVEEGLSVDLNDLTPGRLKTPPQRTQKPSRREMCWLVLGCCGKCCSVKGNHKFQVLNENMMMSLSGRVPPRCSGCNLLLGFKEYLH